MTASKKSGTSRRSGVAKNKSSSLFSLGLLLGTLSLHGGYSSAVVDEDHAPRDAPAHHRSLQTNTNIIFIDPPGNYSEVDLQVW